MSYGSHLDADAGEQPSWGYLPTNQHESVSDLLSRSSSSASLTNSLSDSSSESEYVESASPSFSTDYRDADAEEDDSEAEGVEQIGVRVEGGAATLLKAGFKSEKRGGVISRFAKTVQRQTAQRYAKDGLECIVVGKEDVRCRYKKGSSERGLRSEEVAGALKKAGVSGKLVGGARQSGRYVGGGDSHVAQGHSKHAGAGALGGSAVAKEERERVLRSIILTSHSKTTRDKARREYRSEIGRLPKELRSRGKSRHAKIEAGKATGSANSGNKSHGTSVHLSLDAGKSSSLPQKDLPPSPPLPKPNTSPSLPKTNPPPLPPRPQRVSEYLGALGMTFPMNMTAIGAAMHGRHRGHNEGRGEGARNVRPSPEIHYRGTIPIKSPSSRSRHVYSLRQPRGTVSSDTSEEGLYMAPGGAYYSATPTVGAEMGETPVHDDDDDENIEDSDDVTEELTRALWDALVTPAALYVVSLAQHTEQARAQKRAELAASMRAILDAAHADAARASHRDATVAFFMEVVAEVARRAYGTLSAAHSPPPFAAQGNALKELLDTLERRVRDYGAGKDVATRTLLSNVSDRLREALTQLAKAVRLAAGTNGLATSAPADAMSLAMRYLREAAVFLTDSLPVATKTSPVPTSEKKTTANKREKEGEDRVEEGKAVELVGGMLGDAWNRLREMVYLLPYYEMVRDPVEAYEGRVGFFNRKPYVREGCALAGHALLHEPAAASLAIGYKDGCAGTPLWRGNLGTMYAGVCFEDECHITPSGQVFEAVLTGGEVPAVAVDGRCELVARLSAERFSPVSPGLEADGIVRLMAEHARCGTGRVPGLVTYQLRVSPCTAVTVLVHLTFEARIEGCRPCLMFRLVRVRLVVPWAC